MSRDLKEVGHERIDSEENSREKEIATTKDLACSISNKEARMLEKSEQGKKRGGDKLWERWSQYQKRADSTIICSLLQGL